MEKKWGKEKKELFNRWAEYNSKRDMENGVLIVINGEDREVLVFIDAMHPLVLEIDETGIYAVTNNGSGYAYKISKAEYKRLSKLNK